MGFTIVVPSNKLDVLLLKIKHFIPSIVPQ